VVSGREANRFRQGQRNILSEERWQQPRRLSIIAGTSNDLRWSPERLDSAFFTVNDPQTNNRSIWQASADGRNLHPLLPGWNATPNECCGKWTPDGRHFVFQALRDDTANLWALNEPDGLFRPTRHVPVQLTTEPMNVGNPVPSRDGKKLFVQAGVPAENWSATTSNPDNSPLTFRNLGDGTRFLS